MIIREIRFANYMTLRSDHIAKEKAAGISPRGQHDRFSMKLQISARYLSHINNQRKFIGHCTARKIETALGLPMGWMDNDHSPAQQPPFDKLLELCLRDRPQEVMEAVSTIAAKIIVEQCRKLVDQRAG